MGSPAKIIIQVITKTCEYCPHAVYDSHYGMSYDSGYDCFMRTAGNARIVDDWEISNSKNPDPKGWPSIPSDCPLKDIGDAEEILKQYGYVKTKTNPGNSH